MTLKPKYLTRSNVLSKVNERDIFQTYFGQKIDLRRNKYTNPFRVDNNPGSCHFNWYRGRLRFFDKAIGESFDCFEFIMRLYSCTFYEALYKINVDFNLGLMHNPDYLQPTTDSRLDRKILPPFKANSSVDYLRDVSYDIELREWNSYDGEYWKLRYGITCKTLMHFDVVPVQSYSSNYQGNHWIKMYDYTKTDPCYVYRRYEDGKLSVKLYRPLTTDKDLKWCGNMKAGIHNYDKLPQKGHTLFIVSSLKDGMCLHEMGLLFCAPTGETTRISEEVWNDLNNRFSRIFYMLDCDQAGINWMQKMYEETGTEYIIIPSVNSSKDIAELVEQVGLEQTKSIIKNKCHEISNTVSQNGYSGLYQRSYKDLVASSSSELV